MTVMAFETEDRDPVHGDFPRLTTRVDEFFEFQGKERYLVGKVVAEINAAPQNYRFGVITFDLIGPQLDGQGNIDMTHVDAMTPERSRAPIIMVTEANDQLRIIDGYHRATRSRKDGERYVGVWVLDKAQTRACKF